MKKLHDWDARLARWATGQVGTPFAWGGTDCAILAFEALDAMAGGNLAAQYRGEWNTELGARRFQIKHRTDLLKVILRAGCAPVEPHFQQRGDLLIVEENGFQCAHVCMGLRSLSSWPDMGVHWCRTLHLLKRGAAVYRLQD